METPRYAYTTLITRASYLSGILILGHTLRKHSKLPLIIIYTASLSTAALRVLEYESAIEGANLILKRVDLLIPAKEGKLIAERFRETWTKLRVFELWEYEWDGICYLDADIAIYNGIDEVFTAAGLPAVGKLINKNASSLNPKHPVFAASPICCCNLDHDSWAPADWTKDNCPFTAVQHPESLQSTPNWEPGKPVPWRSLNGGVFVFQPSQQLWNNLVEAFNQWGEEGKLATMQFPDQDFLAQFWNGQWKGLSWRFNALKTMRYWHPEIWREADVVALHYIVDKPWAARMKDDGIAGYLGRDGDTHRRWWSEWQEWESEREQMGMIDLLRLARSGDHIAGYEDVKGSDMMTIGANVQDLAKNWEASKGVGNIDHWKDL
jgi:inositol 3-alpha-galactosyltransferase